MPGTDAQVPLKARSRRFSIETDDGNVLLGDEDMIDAIIPACGSNSSPIASDHTMRFDVGELVEAPNMEHGRVLGLDHEGDLIVSTPLRTETWFANRCKAATEVDMTGEPTRICMQGKRCSYD